LPAFSEHVRALRSRGARISISIQRSTHGSQKAAQKPCSVNITIACSGNAPWQTAHSGRRGLSGWPHDNGGIPGRKVSFAVIADYDLEVGRARSRLRIRAGRGRCVVTSARHHDTSFLVVQTLWAEKIQSTTDA